MKTPKAQQFDDAVTHLLFLVENSRLPQGLTPEAFKAAQAFVVYAANVAEWPEQWMGYTDDGE